MQPFEDEETCKGSCYRHHVIVLFVVNQHTLRNSFARFMSSPVHPTGEEFEMQQPPVNWITRSWKSRDYLDSIVFEELRFPNVFRPILKRQAVAEK